MEINKKYQSWTRIFIGVTILAIGIFDVYIMIVGGTGTTISHELIMWSYKYPAFPFLMGFVMGHLFWRMPSTSETNKVEEIHRE